MSNALEWYNVICFTPFINYRYASIYERDHVIYRDLFKAYGIRFIIKVSGRAGKFGIMPLLQNIGSGIGLLALVRLTLSLLHLSSASKSSVRGVMRSMMILF